MKKIFMFTVLILSLIMLVSCDNSNMKISRKEKDDMTKTRSVIKREITVGEAVTNIIDTGENRVSNIRTACSIISGKSFLPDEEFSFNSITGERSKKNGYKYAPVIANGEKSYGIGGGVCQVSSTIYMAAINAGLEITEHHSHSESVAYAPENKDATVVYGVKDLKFKNNTGDILYVYTWISDGKVFAKIVKEAGY